jgi:hypothetical protein
MNDERDGMLSTRLALGVGLPACILALAVVPFVTGRDRLPATIATHWSFSGQANGNMSLSTIRAVVVAVAVLSCLVLMAGAFSRRTSDTQFPMLVAVAGFAGAFVALLGWSTVKLNLDNNDWHVVPGPPGWHLAMIILGPLAVGAFSGVTSSRLAMAGRAPAQLVPPPAEVPLDRSALPWSRTMSNRWLVGTSGTLAATGVAIMAIHPSLTGVPFLVAGVVLFPFSTIRVEVNAEGLFVYFGHLVWPRVRIELADMASAEAIDLRPMQWGGWGYRGSLKVFNRAAVVLRKGDAIAVTLKNGKRFAVTVDDARPGAALVNALISEQPRATTGPPTPD